MITDSLLTKTQLIRASDMLKAMSHPIRVSILYLLKDGDKKTVAEIQECINIEQSTASHHLGILKDRGILCSKRDGKNIYYYTKHAIFGQFLECMYSCSCD
ncbi:MAG: winged helix-turn-helix transcriptional regulator [Prolixibacteraceae bacterium]|nr:winged helix-turn-helix transcriptional regulator [Prolixibacteraceae bacterium]